MRLLLTRLWRNEAGHASLEAVIVMPLAISLMVGGVEFGRILSAQATVDKSMRSAARYLAQVPAAAVCGWGLTNARNLAVYGQMTTGSTPLVPGWTTGMVTLASPDCSAGGAPSVVQLNAAVPYTVTMLSAIGLTNSFTLSVNHQERHIGE